MKIQKRNVFTETIIFRASPMLIAQLEAAVTGAGNTKSEFIRESVRRNLRRLRRTSDRSLAANPEVGAALGIPVGHTTEDEAA